MNHHPFALDAAREAGRISARRAELLAHLIGDLDVEMLHRRVRSRSSAPQTRRGRGRLLGPGDGSER